MFREIRRSEKITERLEDKVRNEKYKNMKPEKEMSIDQMNELINKMFEN